MLTPVVEYRTSPGLRAWRRRQSRGAIMRPSTFRRIERRAAARGYRNPKAVAGAAYWRTARRKYSRAKSRASGR